MQKYMVAGRRSGGGAPDPSRGSGSFSRRSVLGALGLTVVSVPVLASCTADPPPAAPVPQPAGPPAPGPPAEPPAGAFVPGRPRFRDATYAGETISLRNDAMYVDLHRRHSGWGWIEIAAADGRPLGVLPHLGELTCTAGGLPSSYLDIPRRMEAASVERSTTDRGEQLLLHVRAQPSAAVLKGGYTESLVPPDEAPLAEGVVTLVLEPGKGLLRLSFELVNETLPSVVSLRGPWLLAGADGFGADKDDAIFPGLDWVEGAEWSSADDFFLERQSLRSSPHPSKVTAPVMAVSHGGAALALAWDPLEKTAEYPPLFFASGPQPVFASPDFVHRRNRHVLGLALPRQGATQRENDTLPVEPTPLVRKQQIRFTSAVSVTPGTSLDAIVGWVARNGFPEPPAPKMPADVIVERVATSYDTNLWDEGAGFGWAKGEFDGGGSPYVPSFAERYVRENPSSATARGLAEKLAKVRGYRGFPGTEDSAIIDLPRVLGVLGPAQRDRVRERLLRTQAADGSWLVGSDAPDPGAAYGGEGPEGQRMIRVSYAPAGSSSLGHSARRAIALFRLAEGRRDAGTDAALRTLERYLGEGRPVGGEAPETPIRSPSSTTALLGATMYALGHKLTGDERFRVKSAYWLRAVLPFVQLWAPRDTDTLYGVKPCFGPSNYNEENWTDSFVMWIPVQLLADAAEDGIDWTVVDPELDWRRFQRGVLHRATHWLLDRADGPDSAWGADLTSGRYDGLLSDSQDCVTGELSGGVIMPADVAKLAQFLGAG